FFVERFERYGKEGHDGWIKKWNEEGTCLMKVFFQENYILCMIIYDKNLICGDTDGYISRMSLDLKILEKWLAATSRTYRPGIGWMSIVEWRGALFSAHY